jgi:DNA polymerase-3 subunit epsilon/CBS domain-containing protein
VLGSAGRGESLLAMDQDNAVIFAEGAADGAEDRWFAEFGGHVADILHEVGVPYCKGGVMARNAQWRGSAATWRERVQDWIGRSRPEDLLSVDIFFDFRAVQGDLALGAELWRYAYESAAERIDFLKLMAEAGGQAFAPALGWFGIRTENGRADLKMGGLFGIVAAARVLAIRFGVLEHSTRARLEGVKAKKPRAEHDLDAMVAAHGVLLAAVLDQQLVDIAAGIPPSNKVDPRRLGAAAQGRLKDALQSLKHVDQMVRDLLV